MSDLISRQAAIEVIDSFNVFESRCDQIKLEQMIGELPPAQPEQLDTNLAEVGTDCISRQDAIALWDKYHHTIATDAIEYDAELRKLPSARPKSGRWILDRSGAYCCSECMEPCAGYVMMKPRDKFCKMCGAKMEVTE